MLETVSNGAVINEQIFSVQYHSGEHGKNLHLRLDIKLRTCHSK